MGKIIKILIILVLIVIVALAGIILTTDINQYKDQIVQIVKDNTGRDFEISGDLKLAPSLIPTIAVEGVSLGNASWAKEKNMLSVAKFEAQVALMPLLKKNIQVKRLILIEPVILLETNKKGEGNWVIGAKESKKPAKVSTESSPTELPAFNINEVQILDAKLSYTDGITGTVTKVIINEFSAYSDGFDEPMDLLLKATYNDIPISLNGTLGSLDNLKADKDFPIDIETTVSDIQASIKGNIAEPSKLKGFDVSMSLQMDSLTTLEKLAKKEMPTIGPINISGNLSESKGTYSIKELKANLGKATLGVNGKISDPENIKDFELAINLNVPSLSDLNALAGRELPDIGPVALSSNLSESEGAYLIKELKANLGKATLGVDGKINDPKNAKGLELAINFNVPSLSDLNALAGSELPAFGPVTLSGNVSDIEGSYQLKGLKLQAANTDLSGDVSVNISGKRPALTAKLNSNTIDLVPFASEAKEEVKKEKVFSSDPLPIDTLKSVDANINISVKKILTKQIQINDANVTVKLQNGSLTLSPFKAKLLGGSLNSKFSLDGSKKTPALGLNIDLKNIHPEQLPDLKDQITGAKTDAKISAKGTGKSVSAIMAGLNGNLLVKIGKGTMKSSKTDLASSDVFMEAYRMLNPAAKGDDQTQIECGVIKFDIKDGIATTDKGIALATNKMYVIGSGEINLKTETLDIGVNPKAREGVGISAGQLAELVRLKGTLANPKAGIDTKAAVMAGVSVGAAVATGGLSLLVGGLVDRATADENPCDIALGIAPKKKQIAEEPVEEKPVEEKSTLETATDTVKDAAGAIGDKLKGLFGN